MLSPQAEADLCAAAAQAEATENALMLVVGYTDATGSQEYNQELSEKRASRVVNHLQQACGWAPYRMLTPPAWPKPIRWLATRPNAARIRTAALR